MAGILRAVVPAGLRHNLTSLWLRSLLYCPKSSNVLGEQDVIQAILADKVPRTIGVITPKADRLVHSFVAAKNDLQWFEFWTRERRLWWKRHAYKRSCFEAARIDVNHSQIVYQQKNVLETITKEYHNSTAIIRSELKLSAAVKWLLDDASSESDPKGDHHCTRLHYKFTPYQVSIAVTSDELISRAEEMLTRLKKSYVRCLPIINVTQEHTRQAFRDEDALGVYFNVHIDEATGETDIVRVRNRDTATTEHMYFSQAIYTLPRYLKTDVPSRFEQSPSTKKGFEQKYTQSQEATLFTTSQAQEASSGLVDTATPAPLADTPPKPNNPTGPATKSKNSVERKNNKNKRLLQLEKYLKSEKIK